MNPVTVFSLYSALCKHSCTIVFLTNMFILYNILIYAFHGLFPCDDPDPRVWCDILNFVVNRKVYFDNIYDCMLTKKECDLIWKIRHGVIPTGRFLYRCKYSNSPNCNYCGELDDLTHIFVTCSRLSGLFQLI